MAAPFTRAMPIGPPFFLAHAHTFKGTEIGNKGTGYRNWVLIMVIRALVIGIMVLIMTEAMQRRPRSRSLLAAHTKRFPRGSCEGFVEYGRIR
jgi:hypothetical protein